MVDSSESGPRSGSCLERGGIKCERTPRLTEYKFMATLYDIRYAAVTSALPVVNALTRITPVVFQ